MSAIEEAADRAAAIDELDDSEAWMLSMGYGAIMLEGPNGEYVTCEKPIDVEEWC